MDKPTRRHSAVLHRRLEPQHDDLIRRAADHAGVSLSDWVRERLIRAARQELGEKRR